MNCLFCGHDAGYDRQGKRAICQFCEHRHREGVRGCAWICVAGVALWAAICGLYYLFR